MGLISIKEYAERVNISVQSVYSRINKGNLPYEIKEGVKMVLVKDDYKSSGDCVNLKAKVKILKAKVKALKRELALVAESDKKSYDHLEKMFNMVLQIKGVETPVIEAKIVKKKKKKRKK